MKTEFIKDMVIEILENICNVKVSDCSNELLKDLSMDSLRMVMLLVMVEDSFEIELEESDMNPFSLITVNDVISLVSKYKIETEVM